MVTGKSGSAIPQDPFCCKGVDIDCDLSQTLPGPGVLLMHMPDLMPWPPAIVLQSVRRQNVTDGIFVIPCPVPCCRHIGIFHFGLCMQEFYNICLFYICRLGLYYVLL